VSLLSSRYGDCFTGGAVLLREVCWVEALDLRGVTKDLRIDVVVRLVGLVGIGSAIVVVNEGAILSILSCLRRCCQRRDGIDNLQPWGRICLATCSCFCDTRLRNGFAFADLSLT